MSIATVLKVTAGRKLRTGGTVVEVTTHYHSDNRLLGDAVPVLSRLMKRVQKAFAEELALARSVFGIATATRATGRSRRQFHALRKKVRHDWQWQKERHA